MPSYKEIFSLADAMDATAGCPIYDAADSSLTALDEAASEIARAFSGSWLGYHAYIYYKDFDSPPPGAHFSQEWGMKELFPDMGTHGEWTEQDPEIVKAHIREIAGNPNLAEVEESAQKTAGEFKQAKSELNSMLLIENEGGNDKFHTALQEELGNLEPLSASEIAQVWSPKGRVMTRDSTAAGQGNRIPPHVSIKAQVASIRQVFKICAEAAQIGRRAASHLERKARRHVREARVGTNVFIGHGRSQAWRELKDFVQDRLKLPWDEFNRVPVAGVTNQDRLSEMLEAAAVALVIMTAEDETVDGEMQARMNVIHEVGLFQGRLGFTKAIVLFEEGCQEFSNIQGLGQIRFPPGNISASFEEIRLVLEREGLVGA